MNKVIKTIAKQAAMDAVRYANEHNISYQDAYNIMFADWVVRECMHINNSTEGQRGEIDLDVLYKDHFGMK